MYQCSKRCSVQNGIGLHDKRTRVIRLSSSRYFQGRIQIGNCRGRLRTKNEMQQASKGGNGEGISLSSRLAWASGECCELYWHILAHFNHQRSLLVELEASTVLMDVHKSQHSANRKTE